MDSVSSRTIVRPSLLPRALLLFLLASAMLTAGSYLYSEIARSLGYGLPYSFPYYYVPGDMFSDLRGFWNKFQLYPTRDFFSGDIGYFMYPVPLLFVFVAVFKSGHAFTIFFALTVLLTGVCVFVFARMLRTAGLAGRALAFFVAATVLLSYPLAFDYMRLNVEIVIFTVFSLGVLLWWRGYADAAAVCFGLAAACKIYPLIFFGLLLPQRKYRAIVLGVLTAAGITLLALWALGPTPLLAYRWDSFQIGLFQKRYAGLVSHVGYDHSFLGLIKVLTLPWRPDLTRWVPVYSRFAGAATLVLYFTRIYRLPRFNQLLALSVLAITVPPVSYDYTLLSLYPAFAALCFLVVRAHRDEASRSVQGLPHLLLFAVLFTPLSFVMVFGAPYGAQVRCVCLIALLWLALTRRVTEPEMPPAVFTAA